MKVCVSTSVKRMKDEPRSNPNYHIFLKYLFIIYFFVGKIDISCTPTKKKEEKASHLSFFFLLKKQKRTSYAQMDPNNVQSFTYSGG